MYLDVDKLTKGNVPIFAYNQEYFGGTEYMARNFHDRILPKLKNIQKYVCLVAPGLAQQPEVLKNHEFILWVHNLLSQFSDEFRQLFLKEDVIKNLKYLIVVSEYHKQQAIEEFGISEDKIVVIPNAIDPLPFNENKFNNMDVVKIIHISSPDRGMEILLDGIHNIKHDFELNIYNDFYPDKIMERPEIRSFVSNPKINFYGLTPRQTVYKALANSHIHAYPSIFKETFCLSQVESMSAGCFPVFGEAGSLKEVSLGYGASIAVEGSREEYVSNYAELLNNSIESIKSSKPNIAEQVNEINKYFSWEAAERRWIEFDEMLGDS